MRPTALLVLGLLAGTACSMKTRPDRPAVMARTHLTMPPEQLRLRTLQQAADLAGIVEVAADDILAQSSDPVVRQNALLWKANMITAIENSAIQFDPLVSYADLYALSFQADDFFRSGAGAGGFGPQQDRATRATTQAIGHMRTLTEALAPSPDGATRTEAAARKWAGDHPIESFAFARQSISVSAAAALTGGDASAFAAVGRLDQNVTDINARVAMLMAYMPKQIRWEAQLLTEQMLGRTQIDTALADFGSVSRAFERITVVAESLPGLVDWQRRAMTEGIAAERVAVIREIDAERVASIEALSEQLTRLLTIITEERVAALRDIDGILGRTLLQSQATVNLSIDHLVWRLAQLVAGVMVVLGLGVGLLVYVLRPRTT